MAAGSRLPSGHALRPYATPEHPNAVIAPDAKTKYPVFLPGELTLLHKNWVFFFLLL